MADETDSNTNNYYYYTTKQNPTTTTTTTTTHHANNPTKYFTHFFYKAALVAFFLVLVPLFPSQAPEFISQTLNTRGWEILHLVFVGIAVSYGLFSKKNEDIVSEKETNYGNSSKFDRVQSYVSRFLPVSSVFDEENDSFVRHDDTKLQTWSSQWYRNDPVVLVEEEHSVPDKKKRGVRSVISEKPLLLPVRYLNSRVADDVVVNGTSKESSIVNSGGSISRGNSNMGSKRFGRNLSQELDYKDENLVENVKESVVLPSPIPGRSRSGRMEMKEEIDISPPYSLLPSMEESELNRSFRSQMSRSSRPNSTSSSPKVLSPSPSMSSPKKYSPSPSISSETQGKNAEDFVRKKSIYRAPPPPPPPPPPPSVIRRSSSLKPRSTDIEHDAFVGKYYGGSFSGGSSQMPMSVGTFRSNDSLTDTRKDKGFHDGINKKMEKRFNELKLSGRKTAGFDQSSFKTERLTSEHVKFMPQPTFVESANEDTEDFDEEKLVLESDLESENEEDYDTGRNSFASDGAVAANSSTEEAASGSASDAGPDVDKKADEFIAKFREQIRLQRIASIKRCSAAQVRQNTAAAR